MTPAPLLLALAPVAAWVGIRWVRARRVEAETDARLPRGADGIVAGAEPIALDGALGRGALFLHGFGDTPQSMRRLAEHLHARGWTVRVPLLPGHGRTLRAFTRSRRGEWYAAARAAYDSLQRTVPVVAIVGQSMGGALAVRLAAERPDVRALVLLAPYLTMLPRVARLARLHWAVTLLTPYLHSRAEASIRDAAARSRSLGYGFTSARLLRELQLLTAEASAAASRVRAPTLVLQSRDDNRLSPAGAEDAFGRLRAAPRELVWVAESGHVLTVDVGHETVFARTAEWLERFTPVAAGPAAPLVSGGT